MSNAQIIWREITAVPGYEVSNLGDVRRLDNGRAKAITLNLSGYPVVGLWSKNRGKVCYVHDLVTAAFIGSKVRDMTVNHIDGDKTNNRSENLEYISLSENALHAHRTGLMRVRGEDNGHAKVTAAQVLEIRSRLSRGERAFHLADEYGLDRTTISNIKTGKRWGHLAAAAA